MFLQWFGESTYESDEQEPVSTEGDEQGNGNGADGDPVDVAVKIPSPGTRTQEARHPPAKNETEKDRKKAKQIVEQVIQRMTARDYLEQRPPEHFAADIKISAVLLRTALHEGWISKSDFIDCTQRIWTPLFITSEIDRQFGWVEHRYRSSKSPADFASSMISSELSATLLMWALAPPAGSTQGYIDNARFVFGSILSVARLPWLWQGNDDASTAEQLSKLLHHTGTEVQDSSSLANLQTSWQLLKRRGQALRALEQALDGHTPGELREAIVQEEIKEGELLWQGTGGFCVAAQKFSRSKEKEKALTVRLHGKLEEVKVLSCYTIPVRALLDEAIIPVTDGFGAKQRDEIARLVEELMERSTNQESGG